MEKKLTQNGTFIVDWYGSKDSHSTAFFINNKEFIEYDYPYEIKSEKKSLTQYLKELVSNKVKKLYYRIVVTQVELDGCKT